MLQFKVNEILLAAGHRYPVAWLVKHCGFAKGKAYKIVQGKQKSINLRDASKLCENLNCTPNELMYWKKMQGNKIPDTHPCITRLTLPDKNSDWYKLFKQLPANQILELHAIALERLNKK